MATIKTAIAEIVAELKYVTELRRVPDAPPDSNNQFPFAVVYPGGGSYNKESAGWMVNLHNINVEVHLERERKDLERTALDVYTLIENIPLQLEEGLEAGRFSELQTWNNITYSPLQKMEWEGVSTIGVIFTVNDVKVLGSVST